VLTPSPAPTYQYILGKRGQLAKVWLAAHMDKKLSKQQVFSADVVAHVRTIISQVRRLLA
jgi:hypothetical protein